MLCALLFLTTATPIAAEESSLTAEQRREVAGSLASLRRYSQNPERRAKVIVQLSGYGPEVIDRLKKSLEKELENQRAVVEGPSVDPRLQKQMDAQRQIMADLRADPELSKEKIEGAGKPALDQLARLYPAYARERLARERRLVSAREQLGILRDTLSEVVKLADGQGDPSDFDARPLLEQTEQLLAAATAAGSAAEAQRVFDQNAALAKQLSATSVSGMNKINQIRLMCGLNPLLYDPKLCKAAASHSADMHRLDFFSHDSPVKGKARFTDRARLAETTASGENIYMGSTDPGPAVKGWFFSPGHHKNMLGEHQRLGLGSSDRYWTLLLGR